MSRRLMSKRLENPPTIAIAMPSPPARGPQGPISPKLGPTASPTASPTKPERAEDDDSDYTSYYAMNTADDLIKGYRRFRSGIYSRQNSIYRELGYGSQNPQVLLVSCADSRADPSTIFDAGPGQARHFDPQIKCGHTSSEPLLTLCTRGLSGSSSFLLLE